MGQQLSASDTLETDSPEEVAKSIHEAAVFLWREATLAGLYDLAASLSVVARQARDDATEAVVQVC